MPEIVVFLIAMLIVLVLIGAASNSDVKSASMGLYEVSRIKVIICGKVVVPPQKGDNSGPSYIIVGRPRHKKNSFGQPEEFEVSRIDYAQMDKNTEVELFYNDAGKYETFRLIKSNVSVIR